MKKRKYPKDKIEKIFNKTYLKKYPRKKLCKTCAYCQIIDNYAICDYCSLTGETAIIKVNDKIIDRHGKYPNCKLYQNIDTL